MKAPGAAAREQRHIIITYDTTSGVASDSARPIEKPGLGRGGPGAARAPMAVWTEHKASDGRTFYYDRVSGVSTWTKPKESPPPPKQDSTVLSLAGCLDEPAVAGLVRAIVRHCGFASLPSVSTKPIDDPFCEGGRGGAFCCASRRIYLCEHRWVGCREVAYELSHALNACRGMVRCAREGMQVDGEDCGYFSPPDVACSEIRAAHWTGRCHQQSNKQACHEWHARWAVASCYPDDEHLEAHVRWARHFCTPQGAEVGLVDRERRRHRDELLEETRRAAELLRAKAESTRSSGESCCSGIA